MADNNASPQERVYELEAAIGELKTEIRQLKVDLDKAGEHIQRLTKEKWEALGEIERLKNRLKQWSLRAVTLEGLIPAKTVAEFNERFPQYAAPEPEKDNE